MGNLVENMCVMQDGDTFVLVATGLPKDPVKVGIGATLSEAYDALEGTPIQSEGKYPTDIALAWAHGDGRISHPDELVDIEDAQLIRFSDDELAMARMIAAHDWADDLGAHWGSHVHPVCDRGDLDDPPEGTPADGVDYYRKAIDAVESWQESLRAALTAAEAGDLDQLSEHTREAADIEAAYGDDPGTREFLQALGLPESWARDHESGEGDVYQPTSGE